MRGAESVTFYHHIKETKMNINLTKKLLVACVAALGVATSAVADEYPSRLIRLVVPFAAGGPTDILSRAYAKGLSDVLKQPVVVDNRPGAGGNIGIDVVAKAAPDGYTIGFGTNGPLAVNVSLFSKMPYDPAKDLAPITFFAFVPNVIAVHPSLGVKDLKGLIRLIKANPNKYSFASGGNGTTQHLGGELLKTMADIKLLHIPYKGEGPAMIDALGGQVPIIFSSIAAGVPYVKSGKLIPLAVTSAKRNPALPDVPTVAEAGLPGYEATAWYGVVAPAGTPKEIIQKLNAASLKAINSHEVSERLAASGASAAPGTPEEFMAFIRSEIPRWEQVVKQAGAKVD
ncbi:Tripartite-type tricarboxylate transporter, receptor component TctC [Noviherbaspirillum suwonense]|uniref:Tripartite-type tricarboxylate transporter, receptor component TctC n=2 Tax=Noviherbaspirillum suwonense TaxID=1224511 RepID=A0ABY1QNJ0_9BURK|nr:Tripartite-type tricarboxylate transporter, receptor component TctC [Noviherbaspirillum suwonense]